MGTGGISRNDYAWEMYSLGEKEIAVIEYSDNHTMDENFPEGYGGIRRYIDYVKITLHNPKKKTASKIEKILKKFQVTP